MLNSSVYKPFAFSPRFAGSLCDRFFSIHLSSFRSVDRVSFSLYLAVIFWAFSTRSGRNAFRVVYRGETLFRPLHSRVFVPYHSLFSNCPVFLAVINIFVDFLPAVSLDFAACTRLTVKSTRPSQTPQVANTLYYRFGRDSAVYRCLPLNFWAFDENYLFSLNIQRHRATRVISLGGFSTLLIS